MSGKYTFPGMLLSGTHASRPAASAVANGALYAETDTKQVYQSDGSSAWTAWGAAGATLSVSEATLGADVTLTSDNTWYDGPSLSLAAGTYVIWGRVVVNCGTAGGGYYWIDAKMLSGATVIDEAQRSETLNGGESNVTLFGTVVLGSTTTVKIQALRHYGTSGTWTMLRDVADNSATSHTATHLIALKVA